MINQGGGHFIERAGRRIYVLEREKGTAQFRLVIEGEAGHASVPLRSGNAVVAAARVVEALSLPHELPVVIDGSSEELVRLLVDSPALRERLRDPARRARPLPSSRAATSSSPT